MGKIMANESLAQARALVNELLEAAKSGRIIPVRLAGQVEAIADALTQAEQQGASAGQSAAVPADMEEFRKEQGEFMSVAVHELRVPMTSIRGYADMLNTPGMGELNDMQKQFLSTIRANARRMESLLKDVSDISKVRGGMLKLAPKMDMYKNIIMQVEKAMTPMAQEMGRNLIFVPPEQGLPLLNTDGQWLGNALNRLVENGLRYTHENGNVTVSAEAEGNRLHIKIQDDGIGMTPEEMAQLGTPYYRADHDHVRNYKGSGLGIPIAYGIIDLLGGSVSVESQPEQGTTFIITLAGMT
jgi:signal transduction histidine kinase